MGYTSYWSQRKTMPVGDFLAAANDCRKVTEWLRADRDLVVQFEYDDPSPPLFTRNEIRFNGVGEDGHETFHVERVDSDSFGLHSRRRSYGGFCKTDRKPYDLAVCCCLIALEHHLGVSGRFRASGDGDDYEENWPDARDVCQKVLGYGADFTKLDRFRPGGATYDKKGNDYGTHTEHWFCNGLLMEVAKPGFWAPAERAALDGHRTSFTTSRLTDFRVVVRHYAGGWKVFSLARTREEGQWLATCALVQRIAGKLGAAGFEPFVEKMKAEVGDWTNVGVLCDWLDDHGIYGNRIRILLPAQAAGASLTNHS